MISRITGLLVLFLSSCSYHLVDNEQNVTMGVPFIKGDKDGIFSKVLSQEISCSGLADFRSRDARYELHITLNPDEVERIGYRYDRKPDGTLKKNIIGTETRRKISAQVELYDLLYEKTVYGPKVFEADGDFDYLDSDNIADMSFVNPAGERILAFSYSLGQLNTIEGASDAVAASVYRKLSKKISDELALHFYAN